jgi:hypothetical protein
MAGGYCTTYRTLQYEITELTNYSQYTLYVQVELSTVEPRRHTKYLSIGYKKENCYPPRLIPQEIKKGKLPPYVPKNRDDLQYRYSTTVRKNMISVDTRDRYSTLSTRKVLFQAGNVRTRTVQHLVPM